MPSFTPFLNLYKMGGGSTGLITPDETVDVDRINQNMDAIDSNASSWGNPAQRNHQFYGSAAGIASVTGMKRGDTYQESDGTLRVWKYDGSSWGYARDTSEILLVPSATQSLSSSQSFTNWAAPGTGESISPQGTSFFTLSSGVITCVKAGIYEVKARLAVQPASNNAAAAYIIKNGSPTTILAQDTVITHSTFGTMLKLDIARIQLAANDTLTVHITAVQTGPLNFGGSGRAQGEFVVRYHGVGA
jgi:hypothetical protein